MNKIFHGLGIGDKYVLNKDKFKLIMKQDCHTVSEVSKHKYYCKKVSIN